MTKLNIMLINMSYRKVIISNKLYSQIGQPLTNLDVCHFFLQNLVSAQPKFSLFILNY